MEPPGTPRKLPVDLDEVVLLGTWAEEHLGGDSLTRGYVDLDTGEVLFLLVDAFRYLDGDLEEEELCEQALADVPKAEAIMEEWDSSTPRYLRIQPWSSREAFRDMEEFADRANPRLKEQLFRALRGRGPFRRFKDVLYDWPEARDAWHTWKTLAERERARKLLLSHGVDAEDVSPHRPAPLPDAW